MHVDEFEFYITCMLHSCNIKVIHACNSSVVHVINMHVSYLNMQKANMNATVM